MSIKTVELHSQLPLATKRVFGPGHVRFHGFLLPGVYFEHFDMAIRATFR